MDGTYALETPKLQVIKLEFRNWNYWIGNDRIKLHCIYNKSCLCLTAKMTQSKTMRTRYHATRPGGTNGVGWDSSQPSYGSYPIPIPTGGRGRLCPSYMDVPINFDPFRRAWLSGYATVFCVRIYLLIMSGKPAPPPKKVKQKFCIAGLRSKNLNERKLHIQQQIYLI